MFLKTLKIKGFKSFAETATLELEPGVTVVVGPNGSGKSNVVDAIGWVLGAQAPSAVRSQKMDDVIFAGSAKRPALGRAEVELTIDNTDQTLPIDFTEVTIRRTLFRTGDSEYSINGVNCRLLDVQELLSDSGVGRQQHVIVSQGQIDAVLNARPEDRRQIIEEAAGVLKYRKRKEKAERRLGSTEANLLRIQDLLREVRRQLRPLEKQADAARRYESVMAEAKLIKTHLLGQEFARLERTLTESSGTQHHMRGQERTHKSALASLDVQIAACEAKLNASGGETVSDALMRYEALRERAIGLRGLLAERARGVDREREISVDENVVASVEAELAQFQRELDEVNGELHTRQGERQTLEQAEAELASLKAQFDSVWGDVVVAPNSLAAEIRGELAALNLTMERTRNDYQRLVEQQRSGAEKADRLTNEVSELNEALVASTGEIDRAEQSLTALGQATTDREAALHQCEVRHDDRRMTAQKWSARVEALQLGLDQARSDAGYESVADIDGVLGTLRDVVDIDAGWEAAFEAACGESLSSIVVDGRPATQAALSSLVAKRGGGAVLVLDSEAMPTGGSELLDHVRVTHATAAPVLNRLLEGVVVCHGDWTEALDQALADRGRVVITLAGDRFGPSGFRVGAAGSGATAAALEEAEAEALGSAQEAERAKAELSDAREQLKSAQVRQRDQEARHRALRSQHDSLANRIERARRDLDDTSSAAESMSQHVIDAQHQMERELGRFDELQAKLPELEAAEEELSAKAQQMAAERRDIDDKAAQVGALRTDAEVRFAGLADRAKYLTQRVDQHSQRLNRLATERDAAQQSRVLLDAKHAALIDLHDIVVDRLTVIDEQVTVMREARRRHSEANRALVAHLDSLRKERTSSEQQLEALRERLSRAEIQDAESKMRLEAVAETIRLELDCDPSEAKQTPAPEVEGVSPAARLRELERDIKMMGPINPLALVEHAALLERHEFLEHQLNDIRSTRRDLAKVIRAVDEEIVSVFAGAYADVSENFVLLFDMLFPGGQGKLTLTQPDNLLDTGIEIEAKPSGKNVKKLSLLSGGERSLTALAFLFAVFRSRPSPFYVMDEVEAALDDVNLHRFLALVTEFRNTAQLIIVSHQKRTMEAADVLYGVTMEPGGSSRVLSERVTSDA